MKREKSAETGSIENETDQGKKGMWKIFFRWIILGVLMAAALIFSAAYKNIIPDNKTCFTN